MDVEVWVMPKIKQVLITDDPGVPVSACVLPGEPPELSGTYKCFDNADAACEYGKQEAERLQYKLVESWRFAPWVEGPDDYNYWDDDDDFDDPEWDGRRWCIVCGGDGMEDDSSPCPECDGTGINPVYW